MTTEWGNSCWLLFHSTAVKLKEDQTHLVPVILNLIYNICNNLPCPTCSEHAMSTFKLLKRERIKTKEDLIKCIWQFHNIVNRHTGKPFYSREKHDDLYKNTNLGDILMNWIKIMSRTRHGDRNMLYTFSRTNIVKKVIEFYKKHKSSFI